MSSTPLFNVSKKRCNPGSICDQLDVSVYHYVIIKGDAIIILANYAKIKRILKGIRRDAKFALQVFCTIYELIVGEKIIPACYVTIEQNF